MAGTVPRFLRQTRLGYLPTTCVIGSRLIRGEKGNNLYYDIVMLPVREFVRMRSNVGLQHVIAPALQAGPTFTPGYVVADACEVSVPVDEPDPETYARDYFRVHFKLSESEPPVSPIPKTGIRSNFSRAAYECTAR